MYYLKEEDLYFLAYQIGFNENDFTENLLKVLKEQNKDNLTANEIIHYCSNKIDIDLLDKKFFNVNLEKISILGYLAKMGNLLENSKSKKLLNVMIDNGLKCVFENAPDEVRCLNELFANASKLNEVNPKLNQKAIEKIIYFIDKNDSSGFNLYLKLFNNVWCVAKEQFLNEIKNYQFSENHNFKFLTKIQQSININNDKENIFDYISHNNFSEQNMIRLNKTISLNNLKLIYYGKIHKIFNKNVDTAKESNFIDNLLPNISYKIIPYLNENNLMVELVGGKMFFKKEIKINNISNFNNKEQIEIFDKEVNDIYIKLQDFFKSENTRLENLRDENEIKKAIEIFSLNEKINQIENKKQNKIKKI